MSFGSLCISQTFFLVKMLEICYAMIRNIRKICYAMIGHIWKYAMIWWEIYGTTIRQAFGPRRVRSWTSSLFSLDLVFRRLGPWISITIVFQYWPGATYTAAQGPIPTQTTRVAAWSTLPDILLKIALFLTSFFIDFGFQNPFQNRPTTFKNHFQNRFRF